MNTEHNIYEKPKSEVIDPVLVHKDDVEQFYVVSPVKFWVLFISTLGIYNIYWFYKNWKLYKAKHELDIWPIPRAVFNIFFVHTLYRNIQKNLDLDSPGYHWATVNMATLYVAFSVLSNISDRILESKLGLELATLLGLVFMIISGYALYKGQTAINLVCDDPDGKSNSSFGIVNILWILFGLALWALVMIGLFFVPD